MIAVISKNGNIVFNDGKRSISVPSSAVYTVVKEDTISFLLTERYPNEGQCIIAGLAKDITVNGRTYTPEQWESGSAMSGTGSGGNFRIEIVDELPIKGEDGVIYFIPNGDGTFTEWIWLDKIQQWEMIGTFKGDFDLSNYYTKEEVDEKIAKASGLPIYEMNTGASSRPFPENKEVYDKLLADYKGIIYQKDIGNSVDYGYTVNIVKKYQNPDWYFLITFVKSSETLFQWYTYKLEKDGTYKIFGQGSVRKDTEDRLKQVEEKIEQGGTFDAEYVEATEEIKFK